MLELFTLPGLSLLKSLAPVCIAIALRAGTVTVNDPPETVTLPKP